MTALIYSILIALNLIVSPSDFNERPIEEQQELLIITEDHEM